MSQSQPKTSVSLINELAGFQPFENDLLVRSELLIEKQREHIKSLKERLRESESCRRSDTHQSGSELRILKEANAKLRLELDLLRGELAVRNEVISVTESGTNQWKQEIFQLNEQLQETTRALKALEAENLLINKLKQENEGLKKGSLHNLTSVSHQGNIEPTEKRLRDVETQILDSEALLVALQNKIDESRIAIKCIGDAEYELMETREIVKDQQGKMACLQQMLDAAVKEKQILPPTLIIDKSSFYQDGVSQIPLSDLEMRKENRLPADDPRSITNELVSVRQELKVLGQTLEGDHESSNIILRFVNVFSSLQDKLNKQLEDGSKQMAVPGGLFINLDVEHTKLQMPSETIPREGSELMEFVKTYFDNNSGRIESMLHSRVLFVGPRYFAICEDSEGRVMQYKFHQWDCICVWDELLGWIVLRCTPGGDESAAECHVLSFGASDQYQRAFYALQYANIVPPGQIPTKYEDQLQINELFTAVFHGGGDIEIGRYALNDLKFIIRDGRVEIADRRGTSLATITPEDSYLQCDSQCECFKIWAPEAVVRRLFGGSEKSDQGPLFQFDCLFRNPHKGYVHYLGDLSSLKWKEIVLSSEIYPQVLKQILLSQGKEGSDSLRSTQDRADQPQLASELPPIPSSSSSESSADTAKPLPQSKTNSPTFVNLPIGSLSSPSSSSSSDSSLISRSKSSESLASQPVIVRSASEPGPPSSAGYSLEEFQQSLANLKDDEYDQLVIEPGVAKIMADGETVLSELRPDDYLLNLNDRKLEIDLLQFDSVNKDEIIDQYTFGFPEQQIYEVKRDALLQSGFKEVDEQYFIRNHDETDDGCAIVEQNVVKIKGLVIRADQSQVEMSPKRREILITERLPTGRSRRVKLDCTATQYKNWVRALTWAGFKVEGMKTAPTKQSGLRQFRFRILTRKESFNKELFKFNQNDDLELFATPVDKRPTFWINRINSALTTDVANRQLICQINAGSPNCVLLTVVFPVLQDFDDIVSSLNQRNMLSEELPNEQHFPDPNVPIVLIRKGLFQYFPSSKDYNERKPAGLVLSSDIFAAEPGPGNSIRIKPRGNVLKELISFRKEVENFQLFLECDKRESEKLRYGFIRSGMWGDLSLDKEEDLPPHVMLTIAFHGSCKYIWQGREVALHGKVDQQLLNNINHTSTNARHKALAVYKNNLKIKFKVLPRSVVKNPHEEAVKFTKQTRHIVDPAAFAEYPTKRWSTSETLAEESRMKEYTSKRRSSRLFSQPDLDVVEEPIKSFRTKTVHSEQLGKYSQLNSPLFDKVAKTDFKLYKYRPSDGKYIYEDSPVGPAKETTRTEPSAYSPPRHEDVREHQKARPVKNLKTTITPLATPRTDFQPELQSLSHLEAKTARVKSSINVPKNSSYIKKPSAKLAPLSNADQTFAPSHHQDPLDVMHKHEKEGGKKSLLKKLFKPSSVSSPTSSEYNLNAKSKTEWKEMLARKKVFKKTQILKDWSLKKARQSGMADRSNLG